MGAPLTLLFDGSFEGLMTAFFDAYARRPHPVALLPGAACQLEFGQRYATISTDEAKAARVVRGIRRCVGEFAYEKAWMAFLLDKPDISQTIYQYLLWGFEVGPDIRTRLVDDRALAIDKAVALVAREACALREFLRLSEREGGVYYGEISPQHRILPLLMPHFVERFSARPFLIQDCTHQLARVAQGGDWYITDSSTLAMPDISAREAAIQQLWKTFYQRIAIKERINPQLQRQLMPKKYWKHMVEMNSLPLDNAPLAYQPPLPPLSSGHASLPSHPLGAHNAPREKASSAHKSPA